MFVRSANRGHTKTLLLILGKPIAMPLLPQGVLSASALASENKLYQSETVNFSHKSQGGALGPELRHTKRKDPALHGRETVGRRKTRKARDFQESVGRFIEADGHSVRRK